MRIHVEMTAEEFQEFMTWKADKKVYDAEFEAVDDKIEYLNKKILWALEADSERPEEVRIISQEHASELVDMAKEYFC